MRARVGISTPVNADRDTIHPIHSRIRTDG
jgi:hypothetical protein